MLEIWHFDTKKAFELVKEEKLSNETFFDIIGPSFDCNSNTIFSVGTAISLGLYKKIAILNTNDLDVAFEKTNSIDSNWFEDNKYLKQVIGPSRSSSVGDIFVSENSDLNLVSSIGFTNLGKIDSICYTGLLEINTNINENRNKLKI